MLGRLHVITDNRFGRDPRLAVPVALDGGADVIQVRVKGWTDRRLLELTPRSPIDGIVAASPQMARALRIIEKIAPTDVAVLLLGESGTGKEVLAQAVHRLTHGCGHA